MYIIVVDDVYDYDKTPHKPLIFFSKEDAQQALTNLMDNIQRETPEWEMETGEESFSCYLDGEYSCNHYDATIFEYEFEVETKLIEK